MKVRKKKKGSTFVIVIIVMAIIFTTGTTILAVTANDYKMRINQSKKLQNLYEADSGLDVVENIIIKTSQEAIKYADKEVKKEFVNLKGMDISKEKLNGLFKENFYEFLSEPKNVRDSNSIEKSNVKILEHLILSKEIINSIEDNKTINSKKLEDINNFDIKILNASYDKDNSRITIEVESTFQSDKDELKNKKTISTTFKVVAPDYNSEITSINIYPVFDGKAITADGNMDVTGGDVNIKGDIWIKGKYSKKDSEYTFNKYIDGIRLDNTNFNIDGNIYTDNTFKLIKNINGKQDNGSIYARNIYIGKENYADLSEKNNFIFNKDVIANNDLAMNTSNSYISIKGNFYGINDKTDDSKIEVPLEEDTDSKEDEKTLEEKRTDIKALESSSIIVNNTDSNSRLTVEKDSYIMGVAYLNAIGTDGKTYQTGESVAVKGNYLAYTDVDEILDGKNNVTLRYYSPLQLLESKDGESNAAMKAEYFSNYYSKNKSYSFNDGGVNLMGNIYSVGASIKNEEVQKANIVIGKTLEEVKNQQSEFARNVFAMGDATGYENLYNGQEVKRTVSNQIDFNKIKDTTNINENGTVILRSNSGIEIKNNKYDGQTIDKGLIITNGDITIDGEFNFTGNIITTGNIILKGEGSKTITYDPQVVRSILALNNDLLKDIFNKSEARREEVKVASALELYSVDKFLTKSLWKIVK